MPEDFVASPESGDKSTIFVFLSPNILNGSFKDQKSIPLTYKSQVAGYLKRSYPSLWTVLDSQNKAVYGAFTYAQILVESTNTPDLRESGRLVQMSVDERAVRARRG